MNRHLRLLSCLLMSSGLFTAAALADEPPAFDKPTLIAPSDKRDLKLTLQLGGAGASGNTQSFTISGAGAFEYRISKHLLTLDAGLNYGLSFALIDAKDVSGPRRRVVAAENYSARARYEYLISRLDAVFLSAAFFRDIPGGFKARVTGGAGYARNFIAQPGRRKFWGELGYQLSYENLKGVDQNPDFSRIVHFGRLFIGYEELTLKFMTLSIGAENILNLQTIQDYRLNGTVGAAFKVSDYFSLGVSFNLRYMNSPIGGRAPVDTLTLVNLIFNYHRVKP